MFKFEFGLVTFDIRFQLALGRPGSELLLLCNRPQLLRCNFFVICQPLHLPVLDTAHICLPIHGTPIGGCRRQSWPRNVTVMTLGDSALSRARIKANTVQVSWAVVYRAFRTILFALTRRLVNSKYMTKLMLPTWQCRTHLPTHAGLIGATNVRKTISAQLQYSHT